MIYLTLEDILEIHREIIDKTGGFDGIRDILLLDSAIARPQATFAGVDVYPLISDKAAALLHSIICNHPFIDGNKRTGFTAMDIFLRLNNQHLMESEDEKYDFVLNIATGAINFNNIVDWITNRLESI